ncbi:Ig-like domain-containing protein [Pedobacter aquatilis]|uniref:Ig-like domain-containing protein n=1 Tax=Pedobacter aquatilis TaxID=351343 RepID=UPI0029309A05|nr:Ig-like domain-containing protein [Pedobacter aquatilis]
MKKTLLSAAIFWTTAFQLSLAQSAVTLVATDVDNFWQAYDKIVTTRDTLAQLAYLQRLFLNKATPGQLAMIKARSYTEKDYLEAINQRQEYFMSIRQNTLRTNDYSKAIETKVASLKKLYPSLKPAEIYYTVGAFRSGGTTVANMVLIGSEIAMAEAHLDNLVFTNIHEYVHTQQKSTTCDNLLGQSVMEGVAEFVAEKATETKSTLSALGYGRQNIDKIKQLFAKQMFNIDYGFWLYSDAENLFGTRDLGYYVGYAIAESYYHKAKDKRKAIKELIEVDANNPQALAKYVDKSGYFDKPVTSLMDEYEKGRPVVLSVDPLKNGQLVSPQVSRFTINFSAPMNKHSRNFELGPLGMDYLIKVKTFIGFSADGKSAAFELEKLEPNRHYQLLIGQGFRDLNGIRIKPYLMDFKTGNL